MLEVDNPVPAPNANLVSTNPAVLTTGLPSASVTINGFGATPGFVQGNNPATRTQMFVGGASRGSSVTGTTVTGTLLAEDLKTVGTNVLSITLFNPPPGGGMSSAVHVTVDNPTPVLTGLVPDALPQTSNGGPFNLTINGSNFQQGCLVTITGATPATRTPSSISANQIIVPMLGPDLAAARAYSVKVQNPAPSVASNGLNFSVQGPGTCSQVSTFSGDGTYAYLDGVGTATEWANPSASVTAKDPTSGYRALFVCDTDNQRIRMVYLEGPNAGKSVTIAGTGVAGTNFPLPVGGPPIAFFGLPALQSRLNYPRGICAQNDSNGNLQALYISDSNNNAVVALVPGSPSTDTSWELNAFVPATEPFEGTTPLSQPRGITFNSADNSLYIADAGSSSIKKIDPQRNVSTVTQIPGAFPLGIAISPTSGMLYFSDSAFQGIYKVSTAIGSTATHIAGNGTAGFHDGVGSAAQFHNPQQILWANDPTLGEVLYIPDPVNYRVRKMALSTNNVTTFSGSGQSAPVQNGNCDSSITYNLPRAIAPGVTNDFYIIDAANNLIRRIQ